MGFNCQALDGCIGWQNLYAQEESGADTFLVSNYTFVGVDIHGGPKNGTQNFGPVLNAEIYTGMNNTACGVGTTGLYLGDSQMRGLNGWTINNSSESSGNVPACTNTPTAAILFDAPNTEVINGHCEGFLNCILMGANNAPGFPAGSIGASSQKVSAVAGGPSCPSTCNVVHISNNYLNNSDYVIQNVRRNGFSNNIKDDVNGVSVGNLTAGNNPFTALYSWASGVNNTPSTTSTNLMTTDVSTVNQFGSGVTASFTSVLIANKSSPATAPVVNKLVKLTGSPATATLATTADISGSVVGICLLNCSTTGSSTVVITGVVGCLFSNTTVAGHWAIVSTSANGDCKDTATVSSTLTDIGRVLTGGAANTVQNVLLQITR